MILLELLGPLLDLLSHGFAACRYGFGLLLHGRLRALRLGTTGDHLGASSFPLSAVGTSINRLGYFLFLLANVLFRFSKTVLDRARGSVVVLLRE